MRLFWKAAGNIWVPDSIDPQDTVQYHDCHDFIIQILKDGDMGTDISQSLVGSSSYQKVNLFTYFREGHVQMKVRFPKASHFQSSGLYSGDHFRLLHPQHLQSTEYNLPADTSQL